MKRMVLGFSFLWIFASCTGSNPTDVSLKLLFSRAGAGAGTDNNPATSVAMDCFLVNVRGQEIPPRYKNGQLPLITSSECLGFGAVSDTLSLATATTAGATLRVRPGPQRSIEVYGIAGVPGCGGADFAQVLTNGSPTLHLLGSVVQDIGADTTVTITSTYNPATSPDKLAGCRLAPLPLFSDAGSGADDDVFATTYLTDGTRDVLVGGAFTAVNSASRANLARLDDSGSPVSSYNSGLGTINGDVLALVPTTAGRTYVGGKFTTIGGATRSRLARINADGTADTFNNGAGFSGDVYTLAMAREDSGRLFVAGTFSTYTAGTVGNIVALAANGDVASGWVNQPVTGISTIQSIDVDPLETGVYVGGNGTNRLSKVDAITGALDSGFMTNLGIQPNAAVYAVRVMPGDSTRFYIGGSFTAVGGQARGRIARLTSLGSVDLTFAIGTGFDAPVYSISPALDNSGDIFVTGAFSEYNGTSTSGIARITATGALRANFDPGAGATGGAIFTVMAPRPRGNFEYSVYIGGSFTSFDSVTLGGLARLTPLGILN